MNSQQCNTPCGKYVSWHAILAGAMTALGLTFLFNLLTVGLGLTMYTHNEQGMQVLAFAGFAWILIGIYILLFLSGWVTGRLVHRDYSLHCCNGALHGFIMWALYLILSILILSHMTETTVILLKSTLATVSPETVASTTNAATTTATTSDIHKAGWSALGTFLVFFGGAFGACVGALYGIREGKKCLLKQGNGNQS